MDSADLRVFEAVARLGGMNRAAGELNTVQSNVTARIRQLETELGVPLFQRHARGATLTVAGQRLLPYATQIGRLLVEARRAVAETGTPQGPLAIGSLETTAALRLPPILTAYAARHPAVDLTLTPGTTCEMIARVLDRQIEGAFVCGPVDHPDLLEETVFREELVLITAPSVRTPDALLAAREVKIVVLRVGCSYRERLEGILARHGVTGLRRLEFGTIDGIVGCVAAGLGISLLPRALVEPAVRAGKIALHAVRPAEVDTVFIRRRDAFLSSALAAFLDCVRPSAVPAVAAE
jgi:LysR family transcriptional regulator, cell division regulator